MSTNNNATVMWRDLEAAYDRMIAREAQFFRSWKAGDLPVADVVEAVRRSLDAGSWAAFRYADQLGPEVVRGLLPTLLRFATGGGIVGRSHEIILTLPREVLLRDAVPTIRSLLFDGDDQTYSCLMSLCESIDPALATELAAEARSHPDPAVRAVAEEYAAEE